MKRFLSAVLYAGAAAGLLGMVGCSSDGDSARSVSKSVQGEMPAAATKAIAVMGPTQGHRVRGTINFIEVGDGVRVVANLSGLTPGRHGFHVHENGDCSAPDASSAGGHFAPEGHPHGAPNQPPHHTGDLGNLTADDDGRAFLDEVYPFLSFKGDHSIMGKAVIVHANEDDLKSQPSGEAGGRVACGVIEKTTN